MTIKLNVLQKPEPFFNKIVKLSGQEFGSGQQQQFERVNASLSLF